MGGANCWRRGYFDVNGSLANGDGVLPDTYLNVGKYGWAKGVAFINGFNLVLLPRLHSSAARDEDFGLFRQACFEETYCRDFELA